MRFIEASLGLANKSHLLVVGLSGLSLLYTSLYANAGSSIIFAAFLLLVGLGALRIANSNNRAVLASAVRLFTFVYCFSIIITCWIFVYYMRVFGVPYESGGTDDARFERQANVLKASTVTTYEAVKDIVRLEGTGTWNVSGNYVVIVALVHKVIEDVGLEPHTLNPRLLNGFLLAMTSVLVWTVATRICRFESTARFAGYFAGLLPTVVFIAAHIYRDVLIGFGVMLAVAITVSLMESLRSITSPIDILRAIATFMALIACWFIVGNLRQGLFVIMACMISLMILVQARSFSKIFYTLLLGAVVGIAVAYGVFDQFISQARSYMDIYTTYRASMGSASGIGTGIYRLPPLLSYPLRILYASINPLPFPSVYISENYRRLGSLIWFYSLPFLMTSLWICLRRSQNSKDLIRRSVAVAFICFFISVGLVTMQARQITMFAPTGAILVASGIEESTDPLLSRVLIMTSVGLAMLVFYVIVKFL